MKDKTMSEVSQMWPLIPLWRLLKESRIPGTTGLNARKITVKLYGKGAIPKNERIVGSSNTKYYVRRAGQLIYGKLDFLNGAFAIIPEELDGYESTQDLPAFDISSEVNPRWLIRLLTQESFYKPLQGNAIGSRKARRVNPEEFLALEIRLPEKAMQDVVADLLDDVDDTISANYDVVKQLQALKRGAMHDLLTKGIPGRHTTFQDTELGMLPEGWEVRPLKEVTYLISVGVVVKPASYYVQSGIPALRSLNVEEDELIMENLVYFSEEAHNSVLKKSRLRAGDVVVIRSGKPGVACVIPAEADGINCIDLLFVRPNFEVLLGEFISRVLNSPLGQRRSEKSQTGLAQQHVNAGVLKEMLFPVPPLDEQREIVEILAAFDERIRVEQERAKQLEQVKAALAQQLLTGKLTIPESREVAS